MAQNDETNLGLSQARRTYLETRNRNINEMTLLRLKKKWQQKLADKHIQITNTLAILFDEDDSQMTTITRAPAISEDSLRDKRNCYFHLHLFSHRCEEILEHLRQANAANLSLTLRRASDFCAALHRFFDTLDSLSGV